MKFSIGLQFNIELTRNGKITRLSLPSWKRLRKQVKKRDGAICQYCGVEAKDGHVDHVMPLSKGGTDTIDNLAWSCRPCNLSKNNKTLAEWEYGPSLPKKKAEDVLDLTIFGTDIRGGLKAIQAKKDTRVIIEQGDDFTSPRIVLLSQIWEFLELSYLENSWTRDAWCKKRKMPQKTWAALHSFLKPLDFWKFNNPEVLKVALFEFCFPEPTGSTNQPTWDNNA